MVNRLFFIHKNNDKGKSLSRFDKNDVCIYLDEGLKGDLKESEKSLEQYSKKVIDSEKRERFCYNTDWIQRWAFEKAGRKKNFAEELVYNKMSFWYPVEFFIQGDVGQLGYENSIPGITFYIDVINVIINELKPAEVVIENDKSLFSRLVLEISSKQKIKVTNLKLGSNGNGKSISEQLTNNPFLIRNYLKARMLLRIILGKLICKRKENEDILILTSDRLSNKENATDFFWGPIVKELEKEKIRYKMVEYDKFESVASLEKIKSRYISRHYDSQFIGTDYTLQTMLNTRRMISFFKRKFRELDKDEKFRNSLEYKGIRFYNLVRPRFKKIFLTYSYYIADAYAIAKSVIEKEKPKLILIDHEKNFLGRALLSEAKPRGIASLSFEGEFVYESNNYLTQVPIKAIVDDKSPLWRPIPDKKLLWSNHSQDWYINKSYFPAKNLQIIGAPKYDFLKMLTDKDGARIRQKYGVKENEKTVTVITGWCSWEDDFLNMIFRSLSNFKNINVLVKMHPDDPISNKKKVEALARKFGLKATIIRNENTSELINAAYLVISYASTLVYEYILLNKRVVLLDFTPNLEQRNPYIKENLIKPCESYDELNNNIRKCLLEGKGMDQGQRKKFISTYLFPNYGTASKRAVAEIKQVIKVKKQS